MSVMSWSPTAQRNAIGAAARMAARTDWRDSEHGPVLIQIVRDALTADDRVARLYAAGAIRYINPNLEATLALVRSRLLVEPEPHVAAKLINQLAVLANDAPDAVDAVLGEIATTELWHARLESENGAADTLAPLYSLTLWLAIGRETPMATQLVRAWCAKPLARFTGRRLFGLIRPWLALPVSRAADRGRAFELVRSAARALEEDRATIEPSEAVELYRLADAIIRQLYFASGAF